MKKKHTARMNTEEKSPKTDSYLKGRWAHESSFWRVFRLATFG